MVGGLLSNGSMVIYESTVYPGLTEEICVPILQTRSGLVYNKTFFCGYSPERINPGDKDRRLPDIVKITSGSNKEASLFVDKLYKEIISAGTYPVESIMVAEAAKVIENTQRDINIALVNELSIIFKKMNLDTDDVLRAAETKWNFIKFRPGLVGGHCIGVDPYYLTFKSNMLGHNPKMILAGREINEGMSSFVVDAMKKKLEEYSIPIEGSNILILGVSFKENCPDLRNSKVKDIYSGLKNLGISVDVFDPCVDKKEAKKQLKITLLESIQKNFYDGIMVCVAHTFFQESGVAFIRSFGKKNHVLFDVKCIFKKSESDLRL